MGRHKMFEHSKTMSVRFDTAMLDKLLEAARLRDVDVADVIRAIINERIESYLEESRGVREKQCRACVAAVRDNPQLAALFEQNMSHPGLSVPSRSSLGKNELTALIEALAAHQELQAAGCAEAHPVDTLQRLKDLADKASPQPKKHLLALADVIKSGRLKLEVAKDGLPRFTILDRVLDRQLEEGDFDDPGVAGLKWLIVKKHLRPDVTKGEMPVYVWPRLK